MHCTQKSHVLYAKRGFLTSFTRHTPTALTHWAMLNPYKYYPLLHNAMQNSNICTPPYKMIFFLKVESTCDGCDGTRTLEQSQALGSSNILIFYLLAYMDIKDCIFTHTVLPMGNDNILLYQDQTWWLDCFCFMSWVSLMPNTTQVIINMHKSLFFSCKLCDLFFFSTVKTYEPQWIYVWKPD